MIKKILIYFVLVIGVVIFGTVATGYTINETHEISKNIMIEKSPQNVWQTIIDFNNYPNWREGVVESKKLEASIDGNPVWAETYDWGDTIPYETIKSEENVMLIRKISDPELPFGGTWTFTITQEGQGTKLTITENGTVSNPIYRFINKYFIGYTTNIDMYLNSISKLYQADNSSMGILPK